MPKKIIIIGAGIAGLSAGVYGRKNGFDTEIYEMHNLPGGLCTAWKRKGFTFDGCIHWLTGSGPKDSFYQLWKELGAIDGRQFVDHDIFQSYTNQEGRTFNLYTNADRLEQHMLELSPVDRETIKSFCNRIRKFTNFGMAMDKAFELYGFTDLIKMMFRMSPFMKDMNQMNKKTIGEFAGQFHDPLIKEGLEQIFGLSSYPLFSLVVTLSLLHNRAGGFPKGGSLDFARSIEKSYLDLGGSVHYGKRVVKILVRSKDDSSENNKKEYGTIGKKAKKDRKAGGDTAVGILLEDGTEVTADYVISAADLKTTVYQMLEGKYIEPQHEALFKTVPLAPSSVQVFFGLNRKFQQPDDSASYLFKINDPVQIGNDSFTRITERNYNYDPSLAPGGKSVIASMFVVNDFEYWENLRKDKPAYQAEKDRIIQTVSGIFEKRYPGFTTAIETTDVVTPMTYVRYAGVYKGTYMTWILSGSNSDKFRMVKKTLPNLNNFWLSGMWVMPPGGVPTGAKTSRDIIQLICKKEKRKFSI